jgi:hypothetical protein
VVSGAWRAVAILVAVGLVGGCSGADSGESDVRVRAAVTSVPQGTSDPRVSSAVAVYEAFTQATFEAQQKPRIDPTTYPEAADFTRFSFDPIAGVVEAMISGLGRQKLEFRGRRPRSHISVTSIDPDARPWSTITLSDCQTGRRNWRAFNAVTGKPVAKPQSLVAAPYGSIVTLVFTEQRWGVNTIRQDPNRTCSN